MNKDIALLVVGDPLGATTHTDMLLRAQQYGVEFQVFIFLTPCAKRGELQALSLCLSVCLCVAS